MNQPKTNHRSRVAILIALVGMTLLLIIQAGITLSSTVFAAAPANIRLAHLAPFSSEDTAVDIYVNEVNIAPGKEFGNSTQYFAAPSSELLVQVALSGTNTFVLSETITVADDTDQTLVVIGNISNQPLELLVIEDDNAAPAAGNFKLKLGHLAPFASDIEATRADIRYDNGDPILENVPFGAVTGFLELPAGLVDVKVTTPGGGTTLIDIAPVDYDDGEIITLFANGDGENQDLGAFVWTSEGFGFQLGLEEIVEPAGANLYVAHLAPFADEAGSSVTVRLNSTDTITDFVYGESTGYLNVPAGEYLVEVLPTGAETVAISATVSLADGVDYTAVAIGDGANQDLAILPLVDDNSAPAAGNFALRLRHLAPFADSLDGTLADIRTDAGDLILGPVPFGAVAERAELPAGEYDLKITTPGGETTLIDIAPLTFAEGDIVSAFAVGEGSNQDLGVFGIVNGAEGIFLPLETEEPPSNDPRLYVAHLAPFADEAGSSVTVRLNSTDTITNFVYGESTGYLTVPAGDYLVEIVPTGTETVAISATVSLTDSIDYTAVAIGDGANQDLAILPLVDDNGAPAAGNFGLRLGHLAPFADTLDGTLADIRTDAGDLILGPVPFGAVAPRVDLPAGEYDLKITTPGGDTTLIDIAPLTFEEGDIVSAFAVGEGNNQDLGVFGIVNGAEGVFLPLETEEPPSNDPRLYVAHLAPFADEAGSSVTVRLNSTDTITDFVYGESTGYLTVPAGDYLVEILPTGTETVAISATVSLTDGVDYTAAAIGDGANQDLAILPLVDDNSAPAAGNFALRLGHLAPFANTLDGTLADVRTDAGDLILGPVPFGAVAERVELPAGEYDLQITTPGGETTLIDLAPLTFAEGDIVSAFATGEGNNQDLGVFAVINGGMGVFVDLEEAPSTDGTRLYVAHLAPFADTAGSSVTVRLNGSDVLTEFEYGDSTGYLNVDAGEYLVEILPTGSDTVVISGTVNLAENTDYTAVAVGDGSNQSLSLLPLVDDNSAPADGNFALRLGHLAPFANSLDATRADIRLQDGTLVLGDVPFGAVAPRVELPAGVYDLKITTPGGEVTLIDPDPISFNAGDVVTAFAVGEGVNQPLSVFGIINGAEGLFILDTPFVGTTQIFLPIITR